MNDHAQNPVPGMSFEQLWALLQENARQMKEQRQDFDRDIKALHWEIGNIGNRL